MVQRSLFTVVEQDVVVDGLYLRVEVLLGLGENVKIVPHNTREVLQQFARTLLLQWQWC